MMRILTRDVAAKFPWDGTDKKASFETLHLKRLIFGNCMLILFINHYMTFILYIQILYYTDAMSSKVSAKSIKAKIQNYLRNSPAVSKKREMKENFEVMRNRVPLKNVEAVMAMSKKIEEEPVYRDAARIYFLSILNSNENQL